MTNNAHVFISLHYSQKSRITSDITTVHSCFITTIHYWQWLCVTTVSLLVWSILSSSSSMPSSYEILCGTCAKWVKLIA